MSSPFFIQMEFIIFTLATWRLSSLLAVEDGPLNIFLTLRNLLGVDYDDLGLQYGTNVIAKATICPWCSSVWIALGWVILWLIFGKVAFYLALPLAISTGVVVVSEVVNWLEQAQ